jgi:hypothetical protein
VGDVSKMIKAYFKDLGENLSKFGSDLRDLVIEHKTSVVGLILVFVIILAAFYWYIPLETRPNISSQEQGTTVLPYIAQNKDLVILINYQWVDNVYRSEWECMKVNTAPKAKITYTVKNQGEKYEELLYLPVPDYIYPDQFQSKPEFNWINGLYITVLDQPLERGAMEKYEFIVDLQAYREICNLKNEVDGYSNEVERRYDELTKTGLSSDRLNQIDEVHISFNSAKTELDKIVESMRAGNPSLTLAGMDKINKFNIRQTAVLSQSTISSEYSLSQTEIQLNKMEEVVSESNIDLILSEIQSQRETINSLKIQLDEQMDKPSLEDLLDAYYNTPR